jgi:predicted Zn finger-like uncharacterized protein
MSILMNCPHCGKLYRLAEQQAGRKVRCTKCQEVFRVATVVPEAPPSVARRAGAADIAVELTPSPPQLARIDADPSTIGSIFARKRAA